MDVQRRVRPRTDLETCTGPNSSWMFIREEFGPVQIGKHVRGRTLRGCSEKSSAPYRFGNMYGAELFVDVQSRRVRPRTDWETCTGPNSPWMFSREEFGPVQIWETCTGPNSPWMFREEFGPVQIWKHVRGRTLRGCSEKSSAPYRFGNMYGAELFVDVQSRRVRPRTDWETCTGPNSSWMFSREEFGPVQIWNFPGTVQNLPNWVIVLQWPREGGF